VVFGGRDNFKGWGGLALPSPPPLVLAPDSVLVVLHHAPKFPEECIYTSAWRVDCCRIYLLQKSDDKLHERVSAESAGDNGVGREDEAVGAKDRDEKSSNRAASDSAVVE